MKESPQFFNDAGVSMSMQGFHNEAIACLKKGLSLDPKNSLLWLNLGLTYYAADMQTDSKKALLQSLKYDPYQADAWDSLGLLFYKAGDMEYAEKAFESAIKLEPSNGRIWNNYGTLLFNEENYIDARKAFETAVTLEPEFGDAVFNLRDTYMELGKKDLAEKCNIILKDINYKE
ncbi:tetratricopeptide repeat protein [Treponema pedis]|uniref:TPR protein n=3 Tax=Treponema pedis TaxID=409322 RepID=S6A8S5_9SPIR|nr:tetratricopeptide repeat protein [Treponema pedis]AGT44339.1 TPR protein [Treponema pedis str. T A4]QOW59655.1 tetratricopeptide repeat protein [Treponema pedis]QSI05036.1 tetratricopeptide repeat protein [Treponema pedis]